MIESSHIALAAHRVHIEETLLVWRRSKSRVARGVPDQLIVVGERWDAATSSFVSLVGPRLRPVSVFACLLEAALSSKVAVTPSIHQSEEEKICFLQDVLLRQHDDGQGVVVVCEASFMSDLAVLLKKAKGFINPIVLPENALAAGEMLAAWEGRGSQGVLLLPDHLLSSLPFLPSTVTTLVSWDLPLLSKKAFSLRLTMLLPAMMRQEESRLLMLLGPQELGRPLVSLLPWLYRASPSNSDLLDLAATSARENLPSAPMCWRLAERGKCSKQWCPDDHQLFVKQENHLACFDEGDEIQFDVLEVDSPVTYWIKLWGDQCQRSRASTAVRISRYLKEAGNAVISREELKVGGQVALMHEGYACRGFIRGVEEGHVNLQLMDSGRKHCAQAGDLHKLPSHLQSPSLPPAAVKVTVAGLKPAEEEESWGTECLREVGGYLGRAAVLGRDALCRGRVLRRAKDRLFLDRCELLVWQHHVDAWVQLWETRACLLRDKWAEPQQKGAFLVGDLVSLSQQLHTKSKLFCTSNASKPCTRRPVAGELNTGQPCTVVISEIFSPGFVFVQQADLLTRLYALRERMASYAPGNERDESWTPEEGECVLVRKAGQGLERAKVVETADRVNLFLVDVGETIELGREDVFRCPPHFKVDPAFAVPCSLSRVSPFPGPNWSKEAGDFLFEMTRTTTAADVDQPTLIECTAVKTISGVYQINLDLEEALVTQGFAKWNLEFVETFL